MNDRHDSDERPVPEDDLLLVRLGEVFRDAYRPPMDVMELARRSFTLRDLDAQLAALVEDSEAARFAVTVRGADTANTPRQLTFEAENLIIAVEVDITGPHRRMSGQLIPTGPAAIELRQPMSRQPRVTHVDRLGRFAFDDVPPGPTSLTCRRVDLPTVTTAWTLL